MSVSARSSRARFPLGRNNIVRAVVAAAGVTAVVATVGPIATAAPTTAAAPSCTHVTGKGESEPSCVRTTVSLDKLPAVGESATVRIAIDSQAKVDRAKLAVRLSPGLRLDTAGTGLSAARKVGLDQLSEESFALSTKGRVVSLKVTATGAGPAQIQADVTGQTREHSAHGSTELTVGDRAGTSRAGISGSESGAEAVSVTATTSGQAVSLAPKSLRAAAAADICATGTFVYSNKAGTWLAGRNVPVAVLGKTTSSAASVTYATGVTSSTDGTFSVCFAAPVTTMYQVWLKFTADVTLWRVTDNNGSTVYTSTTAAKSNVAAGSTAAFGSVAPASTNMRAWHAFDTLNKLWAVRASGTNCWTARETSNCTRMTIHWQPGSTDGTYFQNGVAYGSRYVALADADPDSEHLVLHESGHHFMDLLYAGWWPASDCPSPHYLHARSGSMCAWTEGFANAITGYVMGDGMFYWADGQSMNLMNTTWFNSSQPASRTNVENGDQVECRVAGAMIDLWRKVDNGPAKTFDNMRLYRSSSFKEWFNDDRPLSNLDVSATTRNLVYNYTIDYRTSTPPTGGVTNGGFENGTTGWTVTGGAVGNWTSYPAQAGSWYAWMGGNGQANTDTVSQQVAIPATGTSTLNYYLRIATQENDGRAWDTLKVQIIDGSTTTTLSTWTNLNSSGSYALKTASLSAYKGKTVTLKFISVEDASLQTDFLVDTVSITTA